MYKSNLNTEANGLFIASHLGADSLPGLVQDCLNGAKTSAMKVNNISMMADEGGNNAVITRKSRGKGGIKNYENYKKNSTTNQP